MDNNSKHSEKRFSEFTEDTGFSTPKGYFDTIEDNFSAKLAEENLPKNNGFEVPKGYFESLEDQLVPKVKIPKKGKVISLKKRILKLIPATAAASVLLFISINVFISKKIEFTSEEIEIWFENNMDVLTNDDFALALEDVNFEDSPFLENAIESDEISQYLNEDDTYIFIEESETMVNELD